MFSIEKQWKEHLVDLPALVVWLKANVGTFYIGLSADLKLTLHFSEEPIQADKDAIDAHWDSLDESGEDTKIAEREDKDAAELDAKAALSGQNWDDLLPAERKMVLGQDLDDADRDALLTKYPQGGA